MSFGRKNHDDDDDDDDVFVVATADTHRKIGPPFLIDLEITVTTSRVHPPEKLVFLLLLKFDAAAAVVVVPVVHCFGYLLCGFST